MAHESPTAVFEAAQRAMTARDWEAFFGCLDRRDLLRLGELAFGLGAAMDAVCLEHGVSAAQLARVSALTGHLQGSAQASLKAWREKTPGYQELSEGHRALLEARQEAIQTALASVTDLTSFNARAERFKRATLGGGSVSSTMFVGETLHDVLVEGGKATGFRRVPRGSEVPIAFVRRKGAWFIKLMPPRNARPS